VSGSSEYLAALGIDVSDMDKALNQTITLLAHLGTEFTDLAGRASKAERALLDSGKAAKKSAEGMTEAEKKAASLKEEVYNQAQAYERLAKAQKSADSNTSAMTSREKEFSAYIDDGKKKWPRREL